MIKTGKTIQIIIIYLPSLPMVVAIFSRVYTVYRSTGMRFTVISIFFLSVMRYTVYRSTSMQYTVISELFSSGIAVYCNSGIQNTILPLIRNPTYGIRYFRLPLISVIPVNRPFFTVG